MSAVKRIRKIVSLNLGNLFAKAIAHATKSANQSELLTRSRPGASPMRNTETTLALPPHLTDSTARINPRIQNISTRPRVTKVGPLGSVRSARYGAGEGGRGGRGGRGRGK